MNKTKAVLALLVTSLLGATFLTSATTVTAQNVTPELRYGMQVLSWDGISVDTGAAIKLELEKIGIKIDVLVTDDAVMYANLGEIPFNFELYEMSHGYTSVPDHVWWRMHSDNYVEYGNNLYIKNDTLDDALDKFMAATPAEAKAAAKTVQIYAKQNIPYIPLFCTQDVHAIRPEWTNYTMVPGGIFTSFNILTVVNMYSTVPGDDTFIMAYPSDIGEMNPMFSRSERTAWFTMLLYDNLIYFDEELKPIPWLAESWELTPDGKQVTFTIRSGVKWHDGQDLTPEDVKFTMEYYKAAPEDAINWPFMQHMTSCTVDGQKVIVKLDQPMVFALENLGDLEILPKHIREGVAADDARWEDPDDLAVHTGSGPFKLVKRVEGEYIQVTRNENWWGTLPNIKNIRIDVILGKDARQLAIKKGEADSERYELWGGYISSGLADPDINIVTGLPAQWDYVLGFNIAGEMDIPGTDDVRVRRAIAHAINRDEIVNFAMLGWGTKTYSVIPKSFFPGYHDPAGDFWEYDVDLANQILDDAGYLDVDNDGIRELPGATPIGPTTITKTVVPELIIPGVGCLLIVGVVSVTVTYIYMRKRELAA